MKKFDESQSAHSFQQMNSAEVVKMQVDNLPQEHGKGKVLMFLPKEQRE